MKDISKTESDEFLVFIKPISEQGNNQTGMVYTDKIKMIISEGEEKVMSVRIK